MANQFTDRLRRAVDPIWEAQHNHPFVKGVGDGTLDLQKFKFWILQDYLFLIEYSRLLALAVARSPDLETMIRFAELVLATLKTEMNLHRSYASEFGISVEELEKEKKTPTTQGYTDFLVRTAATGSFAELVAALLPCIWGFCEIGQRLAQSISVGQPADTRYRKWIEMYSSKEFADLTDWCKQLLDRLASDLLQPDLERLEECFVTSSRYEYLFWEMAYNLECWQV